MTAAPPRLLAADSFRVRENPRTGAAEVRGFESHLQRFTAGVIDAFELPERNPEERAQLERATLEALGRTADAATFVRLPPTPEAQRVHDLVEAFLAEALPRIADHGEGFPRLELWGAPDRDPELRLSLRPLPELRATIELRSAPGVHLEHPHRKGPSIARLAELNRELGAEALLLDGDGHVLEGATTSLIWWDRETARGHRVAPPQSGKRVDSVTERLIADAADRRLVGRKPNRERRGWLAAAEISAEELASHEVWAVNALHGIRAVTSIDGLATPAPDEDRLRWFREALDRSWTPVQG